MKRNPVNILFAALSISILLISCTNRGADEPTDKPLTVSQAKHMIAAYKDDTLSTKPIFLNDAGEKVIAFNVQAGTLQKIINMKGFTGIRLYFAVRDTANGRPVYTLLVVPRGQKSADGKYSNILKDDYLFDWTSPCPDNCPDDDNTLP